MDEKSTPSAGTSEPARPAIWAGPLARSGQLDDPNPNPEPVYSRWEGGPLSFGPWGRVGLTVLIVAVAVVGFGLFALRQRQLNDRMQLLALLDQPGHVPGRVEDLLAGVSQTEQPSKLVGVACLRRCLEHP